MTIKLRYLIFFIRENEILKSGFFRYNSHRSNNGDIGQNITEEGEKETGKNEFQEDYFSGQRHCRYKMHIICVFENVYIDQENDTENIQNKYKNISYNKRKTEQVVQNTHCMSVTQKNINKDKKD